MGTLLGHTVLLGVKYRVGRTSVNREEYLYTSYNMGYGVVSKGGGGGLSSCYKNNTGPERVTT